MAQCLHPTAIFLDSRVKSLIFGDNGLVDKFVSTMDKNNNPKYSNLFKRLNETQSEYLKEDANLNGSLFKYRASLFIANWYKSTYGDNVANIPVDDVYKQFIKSLNIRTVGPNTSAINGIPKYAIDSTVKGLGRMVATNIDYIRRTVADKSTREAYGYKNAIIDLYLDQVKKSPVARTPYLDTIGEAILDDIKSKNSVVYKGVLQYLESEYNISINSTRAIAERTIEDLDAMSNEDTGVPMSFNISDIDTRKIVHDSMDSQFKKALVEILPLTYRSSVIEGYIPTYMSVSQIIGTLITLHRNDSTFEDFKNSIDREYALNSEFEHLKHAIETAFDDSRTDVDDKIDFAQKYVSLFSTAINKVVHLTVNTDRHGETSSKYKLLNIESIPEDNTFFKVRASMVETPFIEYLKTIESKHITDSVAASIINKLSCISSLKRLNAMYINPSVRADIERIVKMANTIDLTVDNEHNDAVKQEMLKASKSIIILVNAHNLIPTNSQYINEQGKSVFTPANESYISKFTKGIMGYQTMVDGKVINSEFNKQRALERFAPYLNDPTLRFHPLFNKEISQSGIFDYSLGIIPDSGVETLNQVLNLQRATGITRVDRWGNAKTTSYFNISGPDSYDYHFENMIARKYTIATADKTSTYVVDIPFKTLYSSKHILADMIGYETEVYKYGITMATADTLESPLKWGVVDGTPTGNGFKFTNTRYMRNVDGVSKAYSYVDFLIEMYNDVEGDIHITSEADLYKLATTNPTLFDTLFELPLREQFINEFVEYLQSNPESTFNQAVAKSTYQGDIDVLLEAYLNEYVYANLIHQFTIGNQYEYKNESQINKRADEVSRKAKTSIPFINTPHKVLIAKSIPITSEVYQETLKYVPALEYLADSHNATDGISYVTDVALINILKNRGTYESYRQIIEDIQAGKLINPSDYKVLVEQIKSFGYARRSQSEFRTNSKDKTVASYQFKDSTVVLFESQIKTTELGVLYKALVENDIHQLSFEDSLKVGYSPSIKLHDSKGNLSVTEFNKIFESDVISDYIINLKHSDLGVQQEVPSHILDSRTVLASQFIKKTMSDLNLTEAVYNVNGVRTTGQVIFDNVQAILTTQAAQSVDKILLELGVIDANGNIQYMSDDMSITGKFQVNIDKFKTLVNRLAETNDVSINVQHIIDSNLAENSLVLSLPVIYNTFENLLIAQINKGVLRKNVSGNHVTIVPDIFRDEIIARPKDAKNTSITQTDSDAIVSGVQYTDEFLKDVNDNRGGSYRLREEYGYDENGQLINYAEIIINPYYSDIYKHALKTKQVIIEGKTVTETYIDFSKIDKSVLEFISYRIPVDSKASMIMFKVVGFSTDGASKAIVPSTLINRTGWDFDIDTIYSFSKHAKVVDGTIVPITKDNAYKDLLGGKYEAYLNSMIPQWKNDIIVSAYTKDTRIVMDTVSEYAMLFASDKVIANAHYDVLDSVNEVVFKHLSSKDFIKIGNIAEDITKHFDTLVSAADAIRLYGSEIDVWRKSRKSDDIQSLSTDDIKANKVNLSKAIDAIYKFERVKGTIAKAVDKFNKLTGAEINADVLNLLSRDEVFVSKERVNVLESITIFQDAIDDKIKQELLGSDARKAFDAKPALYQESNDVLENQLFDNYKAIITSQEHVYERNRSNSSAHLMAASDIIKKIYNKPTGINFNDPATRIHYQSENMSIGTLKSISVNIDGVIALLQSTNARFSKGYTRVMDRSEFPKIKDADGNYVTIPNIRKVLNENYGGNNWKVLAEDADGISRVSINNVYIGNNARLNKLSVIDTPLNDNMSESSPAIFDAVNRPFGDNINIKTVNLFRILGSSPMMEWDGNANNYWLYSMAVTNHPEIIRITNIAIKSGSSLLAAIAREYKAIDTAIASGISTTEILASYNNPNESTNFEVVKLAYEALLVAEELSTIGHTLKTEKRVNGSYTALNREKAIINASLNINKLRPANIIAQLESTEAIDGILGQYKFRPEYTASDKRIIVEAAMQRVHDVITNITTGDNVRIFREMNPILGKELASTVVTNDGTDLLSSVFPKLFNNDTESVLPYVESNLMNGHLLFNRLYAGMFVQNTTDFENIIKRIAFKKGHTFNESQYKSLRDGLTNYVIHNALAAESKFTDIDIDVEYKERLLGIKTNKDAQISVYNRLNAIKRSMAESNEAIESISEYPADIIADFKTLSTTEKLEVVRHVFNGNIDMGHFMHAMNTSITTVNGIQYIRYTSNSNDNINSHIASFEESLSSNNPFIADAARDIILHTVTLHGFKFGFNIGKIIPASFFYNEYDNNYGHPVEVLNGLGNVTLDINEAAISDFEDVYYRQSANIRNVPTVTRTQMSIFNANDIKDITLYKGDTYTSVKVYIANVNEVFTRAKNLHNATTIKISGVLYQRYNPSELLDAARQVVLKDGSSVKISDADYIAAVAKNDSHYVYIPVGKLLNNEYSNTSVLEANNINMIASKDVNTPTLKALDANTVAFLIASFKGFSRQVVVTENGNQIARNVPVSFADALANVGMTTASDITDINVEDVNDVEDTSTAEDYDLNSEDIGSAIDSSDTFDMEDLLATQDRVRNKVIEIAKNIENASIQLKEYGDLTPALQRATRDVIKHTIDSDVSLHSIAAVKTAIDTIVAYDRSIIGELESIARAVATMERDTSLFDSGDVDKFLTYCKLINRGLLFTTLANDVNRLDAKGLESLGQGFIKTRFAGNEYIVVTNNDKWERVSPLFDEVPDNQKITDAEGFTKAYVTDFIATLKSALDTNIAGDAISVRINGESIFLNKGQVEAIVDNIDDVDYTFSFGHNGVFNMMDIYTDAAVEYQSIVTNPSDFLHGALSDGIQTVKTLFSDSSRHISIIEHSSNTLAIKLLQMQSRIDGTLHTKIVNDILDRGLEATEENITLTYKELADAVVEYSKKHTNPKQSVNAFMSKFGSPFVTTNSIIDIVSKQFFIIRDINRQFYNNLNTEYDALFKEASINDTSIKPNDDRLFADGNLITPINYEVVREARNTMEKILRTKVRDLYQAKQFKRATELKRKTISNYIHDVYDVDVLHVAMLDNIINNIKKEKIASDGSIVPILIERLDKVDATMDILTEEQYNQAKTSTDFDRYEYLDITSVYYITGVEKAYIRFPYSKDAKSARFELLPDNLKALATGVDNLIARAVKNVDSNMNYDRGTLPFTKKSSLGRYAASFMGYRNIGKPDTWNDVHNKLHYRANIDNIFTTVKYARYAFPHSIAEESEIDSEQYTVDYFKQWYADLPVAARLPDIDVTNFNTNDIELYNEQASAANAAYKAENQDTDVEKIFKYITDRSERVKTANDIDVVFSATNLRNSNHDDNDKKAIEQLLHNVFTETQITSGWGQAMNVLMRTTSITYMWFNYLSGAKNILTGGLHIIEEASKSGLFTMTDYKQNVSSFINKVLPQIKYVIPGMGKTGVNPNRDISTALFTFFDGHYEDTRDTSTVTNGVPKVMSWIDQLGYAPNQIGEVAMQYSMVVANAKSHRIFNGKIYHYNDFVNEIFKSKLLGLLTTEQRTEFKAYADYMDAKRNASKKWQSPINDDIWSFIRARGVAGLLTTEQLAEFKNISNQIIGTGKKDTDSFRAKFKKLPSLYDSIEMDENGIANLKQVNGKPVVASSELALFMRRVGAVNQSLHGIYNSLDKMALQNNVAGNMLIQFRKWMYPSYVRYFGRHWLKNSPNEVAGLIETPIFKPLANMFHAAFSMRNSENLTAPKGKIYENMGANMRNVFVNFYNTTRFAKRYYNMLPVHEKAAMNKSLRNIAIFTALSTITALIFGGLKDRDKKEKAMLMYSCMYVLNGVFNEWTATVPIYGWYTEVKQTRNKLFVSEDVLINLNKLVWYSLNELYYDKTDPEYRELYYRSGSRKGESKAKIALFKVLPIVKQVEKQMNVAEYMKFYSMSNMFIHD